MILSSDTYSSNPTQIQHQLILCKSTEPIRLDVNKPLPLSEWESLGHLLSRFLDLTISLNDLTDHPWTLDFLLHFPQTRSIHIKCVWSLESLTPISNLKEIRTLELQSVIKGCPSVEPLQLLKKLESLHVTGKWPDLFFIQKINSLRNLFLRGFTSGDFSWIKTFSQLESLEIVDSDLHDFSSFQNESLRALHLINLRNLTTLDWLTSFPLLKELKLKRLPGLDSLPPQKYIQKLENFTATHLPNAGIKKTLDFQKPENFLFSL